MFTTSICFNWLVDIYVKRHNLLRGLSAGNQIPEAGEPMREERYVDEKLKHPNSTDIDRQVAFQFLDVVWYLSKTKKEKKNQIHISKSISGGPKKFQYIF